MNQSNNYQAIFDINVICCLTSFKDCNNCIEIVFVTSVYLQEMGSWYVSSCVYLRYSIETQNGNMFGEKTSLADI